MYPTWVTNDRLPPDAGELFREYFFPRVRFRAFCSFAVGAVGGHVPALLELSDHAAPAVAAGDDAAVSEVVRHLLPVGFRVEECLGRVVR